MRNAHREYRTPPPLVSGYPLDNLRVSFYKPRAGVNLVSNPSVELDTTGYTAVGGSVAQSALTQRFGTFSLEVTPSVSTTSGVYYGTIDLSAGQLYIASVYGYFIGGHPYKIYFANTSGTLLGTAYEFRGRGRWERVSVTYLETSSTARRIYVTKNGNATLSPFYLDGLQVEADVLTSYIDGDQLGFVRNQLAYYWTGTPHASPSVRVLGTRSGGQEVLLSDYGFSVLAVIGLGLGGFSNLSTPNAYVGGSQFERTVYTERTFDVAGVFQADSDAYMRQLRSDLIDILRPNAGIITQPLMLRIQSLDDCGRERGEPTEIPCALEPSSLSGNWNNYYQDPVTLSFTIYLPYALARQGYDGAELNYQEVLTDSAAFWRDTSGSWHEFSGLAEGDVVRTFLPLPDGRILVGGNFQNASGVSDADYLAVYDFDTGVFSALNATPLNGAVRALALYPNQVNVLVGGEFTNIISANGDYMLIIDLSTGSYSVINATPLSAFVTSIVFLNDAVAIFGGNFLNAGSANGDYLAKLTGSTYSAINATPLNAAVYAIKKLLDGERVLFGGDFTNAGGDANADYVAYLTASDGVYNALNTSPIASTRVEALELDESGAAYIGRVEASDNSGAISEWNGNDLPFNPLGTGLNLAGFSSGAVGKITHIPLDNTLIIAGEFDGAGSLAVTSLVGWNGSSYFYLDILFPAGVTVQTASYSPDGKILIGGGGYSGSVYAAAANTLTNEGSADTYPVFNFVGPGTVYQLRNYTTGDVLYFNLTLNAGERANLMLGPGNISFVSTFRGNIINTIIPGSSLATFRLTPGLNSVSAFIAGTTDSDTRLTAYWKVLYQSFDNSLYR